MNSLTPEEREQYLRTITSMLDGAPILDALAILEGSMAYALSQTTIERHQLNDTFLDDLYKQITLWRENVTLPQKRHT